LSAKFNGHSLLSNATIWGTFIINIFFMLGAFAAIFMVERINLISLQKYGFLFASISLFLLAMYFYLGLHQPVIIIFLFVLFNFALNVGPDVTTYLLPATSYSVEIRGSGHGFIAGFAKLGSFLGVLLLPRLQDLWGYESIIIILAGLLFAAYLFTISFSRTPLRNSGMEKGVIYEAS
jgi:predicted MFS family arabinose efflux permease